MLPADRHSPVLPSTACPLLINTSLAPSPDGGQGTRGQRYKPDGLAGKLLLSVSGTGAHPGLFASPSQPYPSLFLLSPHCYRLGSKGKRGTTFPSQKSKGGWGRGSPQPASSMDSSTCEPRRCIALLSGWDHGYQSSLLPHGHFL